MEKQLTPEDKIQIFQSVYCGNELMLKDAQQWGQLYVESAMRLHPQLSPSEATRIERIDLAKQALMMRRKWANEESARAIAAKCYTENKTPAELRKDEDSRDGLVVAVLIMISLAIWALCHH